ncbi:MAG: hypothetical protein ABIJ96_05010 [Elusimicrobiota bacterium]
MRLRLIFGVLLLSLTLPAAAAKKSKTRDSRQLSRGKDFSYLLPPGYRRHDADAAAVAGWSHTADGSVVAMTRVSARQVKAYAAAKKARAAMAPEKSKDFAFSKVYKKTLPNSLKYYFFTRRSRQGRSARQKVAGFMNMGETLYRIEGEVPVQPDGMNGLYQILGTIKPVKRPKRERAFDPSGKPSALQDQEERDKGVPLY